MKKLSVGKEEVNPFELKHINRHKYCPACEKMYLDTIKMLEKQNELLLEQLRMKHLSEPIVFEVKELI